MIKILFVNAPETGVGDIMIKGFGSKKYIFSVCLHNGINHDQRFKIIQDSTPNSYNPGNEYRLLIKTHLFSVWRYPNGYDYLFIIDRYQFIVDPFIPKWCYLD
jgi:hypothetical protein